MQLTIKKTSGVPYARKADYEYEGTKYEADLKDGDIIKLLDGGIEEQGNYGKETNFKVKTRNGEKKLSLNQSSINVLVEEFGGDTEKWIGKDVKILLKKGVFAGKKGVATYAVVEGWTLDEYGELGKTISKPLPGTVGHADDVFGGEEVDDSNVAF